MDGPKSSIFESLESIVLRVSNVHKASQWYEQKLGLKTRSFDDEEKLAVLETGSGTTLTLAQLKPEEFAPPFHFCGTYPLFRCHDARTCLETLLAQNVHTDVLHEDELSRRFSFYDPDGNRIEVIETPKK